MSDPLDLTVGDVSLLLATCYDAKEKPRVVRRLDFVMGEIPVTAEVGTHFHGHQIVRIIESDFDFVVCVQHASKSDTVLSSNRILKHAVNRVVYE